MTINGKDQLMKTNESILPIENGERYGRIFTRTIIPKGITTYGEDVAIGATLLSVSKISIRETEDRMEWRGSENVNIPGRIVEGLIFVFGETEEAAIDRFVADNTQLQNAVFKAVEAQRAAEKIATEAVKERELMKETAKQTIEQKNARIEMLSKEQALRQKLENDLVKVKAFIGEKAFNEALATDAKKGG